MPLAPHFLTTAEAAAYLGLRPQTLRKWRTTGRGPRYVKVGPDSAQSRCLYRRDDLERWAESRTYTSEAARAASRAR